ncbi:MAG: hypothetical protein OWU33_00535 [Firmicutes bacterium]|nr:hypothetical protein [Bacillota bacterium]
MGFGPRTPDVESGVNAVKDLIALLYPERATPQALALFEHSARLLLQARAALTFENIARLWQDPVWRQWLLDRASPTPDAAFWQPYRDRAVALAELDADFDWLIKDRLAQNEEFWRNANDGPPVP